MTGPSSVRHRMYMIRTFIAVVFALGLVMFPIAPSGASGSSFQSWYDASQENRDYFHWHEWVHASPENEAYWRWSTQQQTQASSVNSVDDAIQRAFGDLGSGVVAQAHRVAQCESEKNPRALNGNPSYQAAGLFQIIKQWSTRYGQVTGVAYYDGRFDPYANARFARYLYNDGGGWKHWVCRYAA